MSASLLTRRLSPGFGVEVDGGAISSLLEDGPRLESLLNEHRLLLVRDAPLSSRFQLQLSYQLGRLVAKPKRGGVDFATPPEMRIESSRPRPATGARRGDLFSRYWHSDLSWAKKPADFTCLVALDGEGEAEPTMLADTQAGYAGLSASYRDRIASWQALHHVGRSRELRYGAQQSPARRPRTNRKLRQRINDGWLGWKYAASAPSPDGAQGSLHRVVQLDRSTGKPYVYLGDHAWSLQGLATDEGLAEIDTLNQHITEHEHVYEHHWRVGDLLMFDNHTLLHRRKPVPNAGGWRTLRRTLIWRRNGPVDRRVDAGRLAPATRGNCADVRLVKPGVSSTR